MRARAHVTPRPPSRGAHKRSLAPAGSQAPAGSLAPTAGLVDVESRRRRRRPASEARGLRARGLCSMDGFSEGDFALADDGLLEGCPYEDDCICAPDFTTDDYVRVTQLYYDRVGMQYKDYAQSEKNLEYDICNIWCSKPLSILQDYCDTIKLYIFWPLLFQQQHSSIISRLHPCVEATRSRAAEISLKKLQHLELMEDIVDLAKKVANDSFLIEGLLRIGYKIENKILAMEEALNWIKYTGDITILPKLGSVDSCWPMLSLFFTEYKYHITKVVTENCNLLEEFRRNSCMHCVKEGELMKMRGNEEFSKQRFDLAVIFYTRAIEYRPENHLLYGNRALCFLRMGQFRTHSHGRKFGKYKSLKRRK